MNFGFCYSLCQRVFETTSLWPIFWTFKKLNLFWHLGRFSKLNVSCYTLLQIFTLLFLWDMQKIFFLPRKFVYNIIVPSESALTVFLLYRSLFFISFFLFFFLLTFQVIDKNTALCIMLQYKANILTYNRTVNNFSVLVIFQPAMTVVFVFPGSPE